MKAKVLFSLLVALFTQLVSAQDKSDYPLLSYERQMDRINRDLCFIYRVYRDFSYEVEEKIKRLKYSTNWDKGDYGSQQDEILKEIKKCKNDLRAVETEYGRLKGKYLEYKENLASYSSGLKIKGFDGSFIDLLDRISYLDSLNQLSNGNDSALNIRSELKSLDDIKRKLFNKDSKLQSLSEKYRDVKIYYYKDIEDSVKPINFILNKITDLEKKYAELDKKLVYLESDESKLELNKLNCWKNLNKRDFISKLDSARSTIPGNFLFFDELNNSPVLNLPDDIKEILGNIPNNGGSCEYNSSNISYIVEGDDYSTYLFQNGFQFYFATLITIFKTNDGVRWNFEIVDWEHNAPGILNVASAMRLYENMIVEIYNRGNEKEYVELFNLLCQDQRSIPNEGLRDLLSKVVEDEDGVKIESKKYQKYLPYVKKLLKDYPYNKEQEDDALSGLIAIHDDGINTYYTTLSSSLRMNKSLFLIYMNNETKDVGVVRTRQYDLWVAESEALDKMMMTMIVTGFKLKSDYLKYQADYYKSLGINPIKIIRW